FYCAKLLAVGRTICSRRQNKVFSMVVSKSVPKPKSTKSVSKKKQAVKFSICISPGVIDEDLISPTLLEKYLKEHIKVHKKLNNLGKDVHVEREKANINVTANIPFSKR
ncbi:unnamed protein product, partial [Heterobilharzia americana]